MPCLPCLAIPVAALGGGAALSAKNRTVIAVSVLLVLAAVAAFIYYRYGAGACTSCRF